MESLKHLNVSKFVEAVKIKQDKYAIIVEIPKKGFILDLILYAQEIDDQILRNFYLQILSGIFKLNYHRILIFERKKYRKVTFEIV
jgi:hypothetical protein